MRQEYSISNGTIIFYFLLKQLNDSRMMNADGISLSVKVCISSLLLYPDIYRVLYSVILAVQAIRS